MKKTIVLTKRHFRLLLLCMGGWCFVPSLVFGELQNNVDLNVTANSGYSSAEVRDQDDGYDNWLLDGSVKLRYTLTGKGDFVKGQVRLGIIGDSYEGTLLELSRAYIRTMVPLGASYTMQIELGKNALAWGEGTYYNAGDVIFGADPKEGDLSGNADFRDFTLWQLRLFLPITSFSYIETVMGIPDQRYLVSEDLQTVVAPTTDIYMSGAGARLHFEIGILEWEVGAYGRFVQEKIAPYTSVTLPIIVKLYVATGMEMDYSEDAEAFSAQAEKELGVSGGLLYTTSVGNRGLIDILTEVLYKNYNTRVQLNVSWFFNRVLGLVLRGDTSIEKQEYAVVFGPQWKPEQGFTFSVYSTTDFNIEQDADKNTVYSGLTLSMQYLF